MDDFMSEEDQFALKKFESMLQSNKVYFFDSGEFEEIVYHYLDKGKINLAKKAINLSLSQHPTSVPLMLIKVEVYVIENKMKSAQKLLRIIENIDPNNDEIYIQRASILSKSDRHDEAITQLYKALKLTDDLQDVHSLLGMEYLFIENFNKAIDHFSTCLLEDIEDYAALYNIIYCYDMLDEHDNAIDFLNQYINKNPYSEIAWHQLGRQFLTVKKHNEAIRAFDYAILIDELFIGAYLEKGKALENENKYEEAISNYMLTLKLDDPTAFTYLQIAQCYQKLDNSKLSLKYFHKAIDEDPMLEQSWLLLTSLYLELEENEKAIYYIRKALEIEPENTEFLNRFAEISIKLNLFEEAAMAFKRSIIFGDGRLVIYLALCDVLHFVGEYEEVKDTLISAVEFHPDSYQVYYRFAGINFLLRKDSEALIVLGKALKMNFEYLETASNIFPEMFLREDVKQLIAKFE